MCTVVAGSELAPFKDHLTRLLEGQFATQLFAKNANLWGEASFAEARQRLGWVDVLESSDALVQEAAELRDKHTQKGLTKIVLSGMGGSSLAPETITARDGVPLTVLDSVHPDAVREAMADLEKTVLIVSSKSGSTVETKSHLAVFEVAFKKQGIDPAARIIVITDPGSELEAKANENGYRVFLSDPHVGGRYSVFTAFGIVPSVLAGADGERLVREAREVLPLLKKDSPDNPGLVLGAALAAQLPTGYIFGVTARDEKSGCIADWIEQLVAESSGKDGTGQLPVHLYLESVEEEAATKNDLPEPFFIVDLGVDTQETTRFSKAIGVSGLLGAQFMVWQVATVALAHLIGVNPFDQPDVELVKIAARKSLKGRSEGGRLEPSPVEGFVESLKGAVQPGDYIAVQAFLNYTDVVLMQKLRAKLFQEFNVPVAHGFGPRYLHSTGQFHKGGPKRGVYLQIIDEDIAELEIPGLGYGFYELMLAEALGDRRVLEGLGRPVICITRKTLELYLGE